MAIVDTAADNHSTDRYRRLATYASVTVALILIATKLVTYMATGAVAILSSLMDSSVDLLASIVTLLGVAQALQPADHTHRFGHGKAEPLAAMAQAAFVAGSGVFLGYEAVGRLVEPRPVVEAELGIAAMLFAIFMTGVLLGIQRWVIARTGSMAIAADSMHYSGDLLMNSAVIAALGLTAWTGWAYWDPIFALGIAAFLVWGAVNIVKAALGVLMDRELPDEDRERVKEIVLGHAQARGMHDLRTRSTGIGRHIEFHLELDPQLTLSAAHDITDEIERALRGAFPDAEFTVHQEPAGLEDERLDNRLRP